MNTTAFATADTTATDTDTARYSAHADAALDAAVRTLDVARARTRFEDLMQALKQVAALVDAGHAEAQAALSALLAQLQAHPDPRCTGLVVFASALAQRLQGPARLEANLYLRRFEVPQIELFNLLGRHVPMASLATRIANDALAQAIAGQTHPTLIDIGIGTGRQFCALLVQLADTGRLPQQLTVVGIEPATEALAQARSTLQATAAALGIQLHFHGYAHSAEALTDADWQAITAVCSARPAINASFALHHIADDVQGRDRRHAVLRRLHQLEPLCLVLSEPDVDHLEPRFLPRFNNCLAHFGAVFGVLDALPLNQADRDALKVGFFGREIADILSPVEHRRSERHESAASWMQRLVATGFSLRSPKAALPDSPHPAVSVSSSNCRAVIRAGEEPVVSVFVAVPCPQRACSPLDGILFSFQQPPI
jgi:hypothetical protein